MAPPTSQPPQPPQQRSPKMIRALAIVRLKKSMYFLAVVYLLIGIMEIVLGASSGAAASTTSFVVCGLFSISLAVFAFTGTYRRDPSSLLWFSMGSVLSMFVIIASTFVATGALVIECNLNQTAFRDCGSLVCATDNKCDKEDLRWGESTVSACEAPPKEFCESRDSTIFMLFMLCASVFFFFLPSTMTSLSFRDLILKGPIDDSHDEAQSETERRNADGIQGEQMGGQFSYGNYGDVVHPHENEAEVGTPAQPEVLSGYGVPPPAHDGHQPASIPAVSAFPVAGDTASSFPVAGGSDAPPFKSSAASAPPAGNDDAFDSYYKKDGGDGGQQPSGSEQNDDGLQMKEIKLEY